MIRILSVAAVLAPLLVAATEPRIDARLQDGSGAQRGTVTVKGGTFSVKAKGFTPGVHGVHLHEVGLCEGSDFKSAGGHWNPMARQHGHDNPMGAHVGDLPNMKVDARGRGTLTFRVPVGSIKTRPTGGLSLVIHAEADDYKTDPSGNSGARIACAVLLAPALMGR